MYDLTKRVIFLFIACNSVSANRWWRDTGYDLLEDSPEPIATSPPEDPYLNTGTPPLNATLGGGIYHLLVARQEGPGCGVCTNTDTTPTCCNNGTFCCPRAMFCQAAGWCCADGQTACPGAPNVCRKTGQTCCGSTVCENSSSTCVDGVCQSLTDQSNTTTSTTSTSTTSTSTTTTSTTSTSTTSSSSQSQPPPGEGSSTPDPPPSSSSETSSTSIVVDSPVDSTSSSTDTTVAVDPPQTSSVSISDSDQVVPFEDTASLDTPTSSFVDLPSDPVVDPPSATVDALDPDPSDLDTPAADPPDPNAPTTDPDPDPSDPITPPVDSPSPDADTPPSTSSVVLETSTSNGVTLTLSHTVAPQVLTAPTNTATNVAQEDDSDVVALVLPWDPRIQYDPDSSWVSTTSSSSVGNCHNGTKVASQAGATVKFAFEGKEISVLTCSGSEAGDYGVQVDGAAATTLNGYKDPGVQGDQCIVSQTFNSGMLVDGNHSISIIVKGSNSAQLNGGTSVEFGGFIYRGPHAFGTAVETKNNTPAIIGGTVGGVVGGILILTIIIVIIIRRRRNRRVDDTPAVHTIPVTSGTPYSAVPTTEYHDPYANSGYGPAYYPNPTGTPSTQPAPAWRQTTGGPFGEGSYVAGY